ncbi:MAG: hypothetical protein RI953_1440 [Pseudomonadota bacterium]|jgi:hypothetical protein
MDVPFRAGSETLLSDVSSARHHLEMKKIAAGEFLLTLL